MSMNEKLAYLAETKEQIKEALINKGATINSDTTFRSYVDKINAIETINNQTKEVTENGTYTPDEGYTGLGSVIVNVQGSGSASTGVKQFATVEEMNASTDAKEGDLAVVYASALGNMSVDMEVQVVKFPMTVKLPSAFSGSVYTMLRSTDGSFDAQVQLSATRFRFSGYNESGSINVSYTSTDGINYTRTDDGAETIDFGTPIKCIYAEEWNDNIGYFMLASSTEFNGLFEYTFLKDTDSIYFPLKSAAVTTDWDNNLNDVTISKQKLELLLKKMYTELRSGSDCRISIFQNSINELRAFTYDISYNMGTYADDDENVYIGFRSSSSNSTIASCKPKEYILDLENQTYTHYTDWTLLEYSRTFSGSTYVMYHFSDLDAKTCVYNVFSTTNSNIDYYYWDGYLRLTSQSNSNSNYDAYKRYYFAWAPAPTQLNAKAKDLLPNKTAYSSAGIVKGDGQVYIDCITTLAETYSYTANQGYKNRIKTDSAKEEGIIKKYNYDENGSDVLNVEKRIAYKIIGDKTNVLFRENTSFITNGITRDYTFDDDYIYACHYEDVNTIIKISRKHLTAQTIKCTGEVAASYGSSTDYPTYRWLYEGNIYMLHCTKNSYTSSDNSLTITIRKYDLSTKTMSDVYSKTVAVGTYYSNALNVKDLSASYINGKVIMSVVRVYRTSSSGTTVYYKAYSYVYDLATGTEKTIQNGTTIHSGSYSTEGYTKGSLVNTDGQYIYITYSLYNFYQYKYDLNTGAQLYGGAATKPSNYSKKKHFPFVYFNSRYALMPSGSCVDSVYHSELTKMDLATGATEVIYEAPASSSSYYEEWATDIHGTKIVLRNLRVCDIVNEEPVFSELTDVISSLNYDFIECIEKPNLKVYKNLRHCVYISRITDITEESGLCDIYGTWEGTSLITSQSLITDLIEMVILGLQP